MADLIIKPSAVAGNKLILQDQAGGDVISTTDSGATITNASLTAPVINTGVSGSAILDEDAMGSDSETKLATQQSIKAYVDSKAHLSLIDEDNMATDSATRPPSQQSVKAYVDSQAGGAGFKEFSSLYYNLATVSTALDQDAVSLCGSGTTAGIHHLTVTPAATGDIIQFGFALTWVRDEGGMGWGIQMSTTNNFASGNTTLWSTGRDAAGGGDASGIVHDWGGQAGGVITESASTFGMSASTTYYCRLIGQTWHDSSWSSNSAKWGFSFNNNTNGVGVRLSMQRWSTT